MIYPAFLPSLAALVLAAPACSLSIRAALQREARRSGLPEPRCPGTLQERLDAERRESAFTAAAGAGTVGDGDHTSESLAPREGSRRKPAAGPPTLKRQGSAKKNRARKAGRGGGGFKSLKSPRAVDCGPQIAGVFERAQEARN